MTNFKFNSVAILICLALSLISLGFFIFGHHTEQQYVKEENCDVVNGVVYPGCVGDQNGYIPTGEVDELNSIRVPGIMVSASAVLVSSYFLLKGQRRIK